MRTGAERDLLPDSTRTTTARDTLIDQWLPEWQFGEYHERRVRASPRQVFAAIRRVRSSDIFLFRTLTFIRNPGDEVRASTSQPASRKAHPGRRAVQWIVLLEEDADRELLIGAVVIAPTGDRASGAATVRAVAGSRAFPDARPTGLRARGDELPRDRGIGRLDATDDRDARPHGGPRDRTALRAVLASDLSRELVYPLELAARD